MQIIERDHIDTIKWDKLVSRTEGSSVFSFSWYLDATAEYWCILVDSDYSKGVALPYTRRAGQEILYTPIFVRYLEKLGDAHMGEKEAELIRSRFRIIQITLKEPLFGDDFDEYLFQEIDDRDTRVVRTQAKRSLAKAMKKEYSVRQGRELIPVISRIQDELEGKIHGINKETMSNLSCLFESASQNDLLHTFEVVAGDRSLGGILCIRKEGVLLYVKGAVTSEAKRNGAMYLALDSAIEFALTNGLHFDFGGSRVKGVRDFNHNLGGKDTVYYAYTFNNGPAWFKLAKRIRNKWIRK